MCVVVKFVREKVNVIKVEKSANHKVNRETKKKCYKNAKLCGR